MRMKDMAIAMNAQMIWLRKRRQKMFGESKMFYQSCFGNQEPPLHHMVEKAKQESLDCFHLFFDCLLKSIEKKGIVFIVFLLHLA